MSHLEYTRHNFYKWFDRNFYLKSSIMKNLRPVRVRLFQYTSHSPWTLYILIHRLSVFLKTVIPFKGKVFPNEMVKKWMYPFWLFIISYFSVISIGLLHICIYVYYHGKQNSPKIFVFKPNLLSFHSYYKCCTLTNEQ